MKNILWSLVAVCGLAGCNVGASEPVVVAEVLSFGGYCQTDRDCYYNEVCIKSGPTAPYGSCVKGSR